MSKRLSALAASFAMILGACSAATVTPTPAATNARPALGSFESMATQTRARSAETPQSVVADALVASLNACARLDEAREPALQAFGSNEGTDVWTEAWLRVDEAINLGDVAAEPLPAPSPVGVERQLMARDERQVPPGILRLRVLNTRESFEIRLYDNSGRMRIEAVREASWALRDQRASISRSVSPRLLAMLYWVGQSYDAELEVVSGYRLADVNSTRGSRHGSADACDFRIEGVGVRELSRFLESSFANVGVGYYPTSGFVHLDDRDQTFYWVDYSGPGQRSRTRARSIDVRTAPGDDPTVQTPNITEERLYVPPPERGGASG